MKISKLVVWKLSFPLVINKHRSTSVQLRLIFRQIGNEFDIEDTTAKNLINTCKIMLPFTEMS